MGRILFFVLLGLALYIAWRWITRPQVRGSERAQQLKSQVMVSCAKCGLHVPRIEALPAGDDYYCCEEHRRNPTES